MPSKSALSAEIVQDSSSEVQTEDDAESRFSHSYGSLEHNSDPSRENGYAPSSSDTTDERISRAAASSKSSNSKRKHEQTTPKMNIERTAKASKKSLSEVVTITPKVYQPLPGFSRLDANGDDRTPGLRKLFSDLSGKQVWHITAPSIVPISSIEAFNIQSVMEGEPIHTTQGISYHLQNLPMQDMAILINDEDSGCYSNVRTAVTQNFYLKEVIEVQQESDATEIQPATDASSFSATSHGHQREPRKQPPDLKMRYHPYGSPNSGPVLLRNPAKDDRKTDHTTGVMAKVSLTKHNMSNEYSRSKSDVSPSKETISSPHRVAKHKPGTDKKSSPSKIRADGSPEKRKSKIR